MGPSLSKGDLTKIHESWKKKVKSGVALINKEAPQGHGKAFPLHFGWADPLKKKSKISCFGVQKYLSGLKYYLNIYNQHKL